MEDADRDKLDLKSKKGTFVGYGSDEMGYRVWEPQSRKVTRSRDVIFNESELFGQKSTEESARVQEDWKRKSLLSLKL